MRFRCRKYKYWISDYCLGDLDNLKQEELERHIHECSFCLREVELTKALVDLFAKRREMKLEITDEMSDSFRSKLFARIEEEKSKETEQAEKGSSAPRRVPIFTLGAGAAVAAAVVLVFILHGVFRDRGVVVDTPAQVSEVAKKEVKRQQLVTTKKIETEAKAIYPVKTAVSKPYTPAPRHASTYQPRKASQQIQTELLTLKRDYYILISRNRANWKEGNLEGFNDFIAKAEEISRNAPGSKEASEAQRIILDCYQRQADYPGYYQTFDKYIDLLAQTGQAKKAIKILKTKADEKYNNKDYSTAGNFYKKALEKFPDKDNKTTAHCYYYLARCYANMGQKDPALAMYRRLIDSKPQGELLRKAYSGEGYIYMSQGKWEQGVKALKEVLRLSWGEKDYLTEYAQYYIAFCRQYQKDIPGAMAAYHEVIKQYPESKYALKAREAKKKITAGVLRDIETDLLELRI